jgi:nicotinate-nucleotide pyrophosphorylase (carboxylating)
MSLIINPLVRKIVALALEEDLSAGDVTASLTVPCGDRSHARILAREELVVCGLDIVSVIIEEGRFDAVFSRRMEEGSIAAADDILAVVEGSSRDLLALERTALNFLQRISGVATFTHRFVSSAASTLSVLDTRKTMPGFRTLDKYATRIGGARNHRGSLGDMVLVKNNHIDAHPQGMRGALADIVKKKPLYMPWEVEVRDLEELRIALEFKPSVVMLDNFPDERVREAVAVVTEAFIASPSERPLVEVSGGVTSARLSFISTLGVDAASAGALTTQAPNVDISMRTSRIAAR